MKKLVCLVFLVLISLLLSACKEENEGLVLRVYNCQDYIDEGYDDDGNKVSTSIVEDFQKWYYDKYNQSVKVVYDTYETNETMLNNLKTGKTTYDLVCPSDYTIQKMIKLDMLEEYDYSLKDENNELIMQNYKYISPYLVDLFRRKGWEEYAIPYMWGTMGYIYNPEIIASEDITNWKAVWDKQNKNLSTVKDSVRDTYFVGVMYVYYDELMELKNNLEMNIITDLQYNQKVTEIMNRCDDETLKKVEKGLTEMKNNVYGFEVDSGKSDIITGKIAINLAWSGDAVFSLDTAEEENDLCLNYVVPEEGSNVWFDGWVMLKGANKVLAQSFVDFLCRPDVAVKNMNYIGYTSGVVGDEILDMIDDWYGAIMPEYNQTTSTWWYDEVDLGISDDTLEVDVINNEIYLGSSKVLDILATIFDDEGNPYSEYYLCTSYEVDLTYLFDNAVSEEYINDNGTITVNVSERGRQFDAQYPEYETILRCGIMEDFGERNDNVLALWENVKIGNIPFSITIVLIIIIIVVLATLYLKVYFKKLQRNKRRIRKV